MSWKGFVAKLQQPDAPEFCIWPLFFLFYSQAVWMDSLVQSTLKSILRGDPIFESAAWFFVIILKFIFSSIFEIKILKKNSLIPKKFQGRFLIMYLICVEIPWNDFFSGEQ